MMKFNFTGDLSGLAEGLGSLKEVLGYDLSSAGTTVKVLHISHVSLQVEKTDDGIIIRYNEKAHFFRALGLLVENLQKGKDCFKIIEKPQFTTNGVMIDISQGNAAVNLKNLKFIIGKMALMGLNMLMLYAEDSFEIPGEPYFGYMRSKYSSADMRALDDYAAMFGIEIIPCVQTLAHLIDALKWECYREIRDNDDIMLVGSPKTYEMVEKIIRAASAPFRTKRIHIGMDEAWQLGQGEYLRQNGYRSKLDIMSDHLARVIEITKKCGLEPMIWSDMYFMASSKTGEYFDQDVVIPQNIIDRTPADVQLVYWDYYHEDKEFYRNYIHKHRQFGSDPVFAGGIWNWVGYTVNYKKTFATTNAALSVCKEEGLKQVFATLWGDDTAESNIYGSLLGLQLFAEHGYARVLDEEKLKERFAFCTGGNYDDFMAMSDLDEIPGCISNKDDPINPSKYLMWQDVLLGLFDKNAQGLKLTEYYQNLENRMEEAKTRNGQFGFVFEFLEKVCAVLSVKSELGIRLQKAYLEKNRDYLQSAVSDEIPDLITRVKALKDYHRGLWMEIYKPMGWEILDGRYGFLLSRLDSAAYRIQEYLGGKIDAIEELEQERLDFQGFKGLISCNVYNRMPSASRISYSTFYMF